MSNVVEEGTSEETVTRTVAEILNEGAEWHAQLQAKAAAHRQQQLENIQAEMQKVVEKHAEAPEEPKELTPDRLAKLIDGIKASLIIHAATKNYTEFNPYDCVWGCHAAQGFVNTVTVVNDLMYVDLIDGKSFQFHIPELPFHSIGTIPYSKARELSLPADEDGAPGLRVSPREAENYLQTAWDQAEKFGIAPEPQVEIVLNSLIKGMPACDIEYDEETGVVSIQIEHQGKYELLMIFMDGRLPDDEDENDEA